MKFATKFLLALVGTAIAGTAALVATTQIRSTKLFERQIVARLEDNAQHMIEKLDQYLYERLLDSRLLAADPEFLAATAAPEQTARYLQEFLHWQTRYVSAAFYTMDWVAVADTADRKAGGLAASAGCRADLETGIEVAVCTGADIPGEEPTLHLARVARDNVGAARGVVVLRLPITVLGDHLREVSEFGGPVEGLHIYLVDNRGVFLYSNHDREKMPSEVSPEWPFVREMMRAGRNSGSLNYTSPVEKAGEEILVFVRERGFRDFAGSAWTLLLFMPVEAVFAPVREFQWGIVIVVLVAGAILLPVLFLLVRAFTRPIAALGRAAQEIGRGNLEVRVPAGSRDELGLFAETFNRMAADIQDSQRALTTINRELEGRVEERTAELLHTNELLRAELAERFKAQEALAVRERLLRLSADIGEALNLGDALPAVLQRCAGHIVRDLDAAFVRIWMIGSEAGLLELKASAGMYTRLDGAHSRKFVGELKIGIIARDQRPVLTNAVVGDPAITDQEWARREGIVAFAGHPLIVDGETVGVMALFSRRALEPFVLAALGAVADRIAVYIGRKKAEESLRVSEKRYRDLVESSIDGVYEVNAAGVFTSMNPAGAEIFGYDHPDEIIGRPALDYWQAPRDREEFIGALKEKKALRNHPMKARKKNGELLELESSARVVEDATGRFLGVQGVLRDVTERVRAESERELLLAQLQEAAANIKTLSGLLPICAGCKKIRDDKGSWSQIETYISRHSEAEFSHGLCPDCRESFFPGVHGK